MGIRFRTRARSDEERAEERDEERRQRALLAETAAEELRLHLEERTQELVEQGWSPDSAAAEALRRFGDPDTALRRCVRYDLERARNIRRRDMLESLRFDVRTALRSLVRQRGFTTVFVLTLALGIGASTAMWRVVEAVLLRPLPFHEPERLVFLWEEDRLTGTTREAASTPDFVDFEERSRTLAELAGFQNGRADQTHLLLPGHDPQRVEVALATHDLLAVLGVEPLHGRSFTADEDVLGGPPAALLTEPLWRRSFGGRPSVVGESLRLDDDLFTIVGVVPAGLEVPDVGSEIWLPMRSQGPGNTPRWNHGTLVVGRLAGGVRVEAAAEEIAAIAADLEREYPENAGRGATVEPMIEVLRGGVRAPLRLLLLASLLLLMLACANAANLLLARASARSRETAISTALGARSGRLLARSLIEAGLLAVAATGLGIAIASGSLSLLLGLAPPEIARAASSGGSVAMLGFSAAVAALVTLLFGLLPVLRSRRVAPQDALRSGRGDDGPAHSRSRTRHALVVVQVGLALMLLHGSGVLLRSLSQLRAIDPGFDASSVLRVDYQLPPSRYPRGFDRFPNWTEVLGFNQALLERAAALPGVRSVALTTNHPLDAGFTNSFVVVGREEESAEQGELTTRMVSDGYFPTNGVELRAGRLFDSGDISGRPMVLLLNEEAVRRYFTEGSPIGQRIRFWGLEREVIGIVENERFHGLDRPAPPAMYAPIAQNPPLGETTLMLRTTGDPEATVGPLREIVSELDPAIALYGEDTMERTLAGSMRHRTFAARLLALFAVVALAVAVLGVYGVLSFVVERRRREVGIRMALGASRRQVVRMVLGEGVLLAVVGAALGLVGAFGLSSLLENLVFGVSPREMWSGVAATAVLVGAATLASVVPAARATRVDPAATLAAE